MVQHSSPSQDSSIVIRRIAGFMDHLRLNEFIIGPRETQDVIQLLASTPLSSIRDHCMQMKILLSGRLDQWQRFDELFEAYWSSHGRERMSIRSSSGNSHSSLVISSGVWKQHFSTPNPDSPRPEVVNDIPGDVVQSSGATGKLVASEHISESTTDFRKFIDPDGIAQAEQLAYRLARSMRNRLSRRYRRAARGGRLDFRKTIRANLCHGGDPITLIMKKRPDRPVRIVTFLDISGSMKTYSRFFLQFVKGLAGEWIDTDAYLFHTKLIRITDAVRDKNTIKSMIKLSFLAAGFGGGTDLSGSLNHFNTFYAKKALNSRTVAIIISDGYDTGSPERLAHELRRLKRRAPRLVWLNPMLGWRDYEPITAAMDAAMPYIDHFAAANSLASLADIEPELARL